MDTFQMQRIDQKFFKFREFVNEFYKEFEAGRLSANMMVTQGEQLQERLNQTNAKIKVAEEQLANTITANEKTKAEGQNFLEQKKSDAMVLWTKAHAKFKEIERFIDEADKRRLKQSLKELESIAA